jgi:hypothetical protein
MEPSLYGPSNIESPKRRTAREMRRLIQRVSTDRKTHNRYKKGRGDEKIVPIQGYLFLISLISLFAHTLGHLEYGSGDSENQRV